MYEITGDSDELREMVKGIKVAEDALKRAAVRAINLTATSARTFLVKMVAKDYGVTQKAVRKELEISTANFSRIQARIYGSGSPGIPLSRFSPSPKRVPSTIHKQGRYLIKLRAMVPGSDRYLPRGGIKVMVTRGKRKMIKGAFVARMESGHVGVFRRGEKGKRLPIEELYGPSPIRLVDQDRYQIPLDDHVAETLNKKMAHEATQYLKKYRVIPND